jgi:hypothetical protein
MAMRDTKGLTEIKRLPGHPDYLRRALNLYGVIVPTADRCRSFGRRLIGRVGLPNLLSANSDEVA